MKWSLQEILEGARETEARRAGVSEQDIKSSRLTGMDARDIANLRKFTLRSHCLIVFRCPKVTARAWHGVVPAKPKVLDEQNTGTSGVLATSGVLIDGQVRSAGIYVSDYDLMSAWRKDDSGRYSKIFLSGIDVTNPKSRLTEDATELVRKLNSFLITKIQHGGQDDWNSRENRGVRETDRFAVFFSGSFKFLPNRFEAELFYKQHNMTWPYDKSGRHVPQARES